MKITGLKTFVVGNPPPHRGGRYFLFLKLITDIGLEGVGEVYAGSFHPDVIVAAIGDVFERHVNGSNPFHIEALWRKVYGAGYVLRPDPTVSGVLSGIEMALWDLIGKSIDKPVHHLLGGPVRSRLRSYTYLYPRHGSAQPDEAAEPNVYTDPDMAAECAAGYVAEGFTALKFDPAGPYTVYDGRQPDLLSLTRSELFVRRIREAVGDRADLLFGTHGQFSASGAIRLARRLESYDPLWFEEPTPPEPAEEMAKVARATSIPVATGERLCTKYEFARVLRTGAASILQMNLGRVGGLLEAKKIAGMAEAFGAQIAPHLYCGPVVAAANIQLAACSPNFLILESIGKMDGFYADLLRAPLVWEAGDILVPQGAGLGVELNEDAALAHPYSGRALHLEMGETPLA
ncbi:MAG: mandelate racemase/muconate lactonizing enzyme family protein [Alphaproteobacteria bacterium]